MTPNRGTRAADSTECGGCSLHDTLNAPAAIERRHFFRAAGLALASIGLLGLRPDTADAMTVGETTPMSPRAGDLHQEKRYAVPATDSVAIDKDNGVIIARVGARVYAFSLSCPHQNTALRWFPDDKQFACPKHKSHYTPDGEFIDGRATRDMDRLAVKKEGQALVVDVDTLYQQDLNLAQWTAAFVPG